MALHCFNSFTVLLLYCWDCLTPMPGAGRHISKAPASSRYRGCFQSSPGYLFPCSSVSAGRISRFLLPGQLQVIFRALWSCPMNRNFIKKSQLVQSPVILKLYLPVIFLSNFKSKPAKIIFGNINLFLHTVNKKCRNSVNPFLRHCCLSHQALPAGLWSLGISNSSARRPHSVCKSTSELERAMPIAMRAVCARNWFF